MSAARLLGRLHGIGVGPGDPELMTLKAVRVLQSAAVVAYFAKEGRRSHARSIVDRFITAPAREMPLAYPVTTEIPFNHPLYREKLCACYDAAAEAIALHLSDGEDVALLCEGDPLFYGSFMHVYVRLRERFDISVCPGVTGMTGCWAAAGEPMAWGDDVLTVLPATLPAPVLVDRLRASDAAVIMKLGHNLAKVRAALTEAGAAERAIYVERGTMADEAVLPLLEKTDDDAPYFALILIPGRGRRP